jgi:hypothetical protein
MVCLLFYDRRCYMPFHDVACSHVLSVDTSVIYWVKNTDYGAQAVALDEQYEATEEEFRAWHEMLQAEGVKIVAPPMWMLVESGDSNEFGIVPSAYANSAIEHNLGIITWTLERTPPGLAVGAKPGLAEGDIWYWSSTQEAGLTDGSKYELLHVLSNDIGVLGVFADWPATVTFFANCMELGLRSADGDVADDSEEAATASDSSSGSSRALKVASRLASVGLRLIGF